MFKDLIKNTAIELSSKQFKLLTVFRDKNEDELAAVFFKADSPVIYFVSVVNFDIILSNEYENSITEITRKILNDNKELFNDAVCVHFMYGRDADTLKKFADSQDAVYDGSIHNIWWYTVCGINKVYSGKGQPDKIYGIEKILNSSLKNNKPDKGISIEKISENGLKNSQLMQVTNFPLLVVFLIVINIILFIFEIQGGDISLYIYKYGINGLFILSDGQLYRIFTYMFFHGNIEHLLVNCLSLYIFGSKVEKYCGRAKTLAIYAVAGIAGGLMSACFNTGFSIGASGAVFGLIGSLFAITKKTGKQIDGLSYMAIAVLTIVSIGMGLLEPQIDNFGHIGGLIGGFIMGILLYKDKKE